MPEVEKLRPFTMALGQPLTFGGEHGVGIRGADVGVISAWGASEIYIRVGLGTALGRPVPAVAREQ